MDSIKFNKLAEVIRSCGQEAKIQQNKIHRNFKPDGTIITETDLAISKKVIQAINDIFGEDDNYNIVCEEIDLKDFNKNKTYTFVLDPIDGTDAYSQGFPSWCVALGILDANRIPRGAIISAPRFGIGNEELFITTKPDSKDIFLNGELLEISPKANPPRQITIGSNILKEIDISAYKGKIRSFASSIIHMLCPVVFKNIDACINPTCYAWDIAASYAFILKANMGVEYINGDSFVFDDNILINRAKYYEPIIIGTSEGRETLKKLIQ